MTYDFLKNFHRRAEIIAIVDFMTSKVSRKMKSIEYGFGEVESINLLMLVLCFIMEKSLVEEICTKNDVANFIRRLDVTYIKNNVSDDEYLYITDFLIKDCLQNKGVPYYFTTYNFDAGREEKINVKLIDDKRVSVGAENVYSYYMTPQGYRFMFNTLEIEDAMDVSIEQFKLNLSIKKRNFNMARNNVDNLFNISRTQIQRINYFIKRVKEDITNAGIEEYEGIYNNTFSSINEQKEGYNNLYELIGKVEYSILESGQSITDKKALDKEIEDITYIKNRLKLIISEQSHLLLKQQELQRIYNEAIENIIYIVLEERLSFEEAVVKKIENNPSLAYPLIKVLRPLFKPELNGIFNLRTALKGQKIAGASAWGEDTNILMYEQHFNKFETENDIKARALNDRYFDVFEVICKSVLESPDNEILLSQMVCISKEEYNKLVPNLKILTNVLLQLTNIKSIDFSVIKVQKAKTVFYPSGAFDVKYCILEMLNRDGKYNKISSLSIFLSRNNNIFVPERFIGPDETDYFTPERVAGLYCPDVLFKAEVDEL